MAFFKEPPVKWAISGKWTRRNHECNLSGITKRCGARCCSTKGFWPPKAYIKYNRANGGKDEWVQNGAGVRNGLYSCGLLGPTGCTLDKQSMPVTCLLYPLILNKNNTLVAHNWITKEKGLCKGNFNNGPMLIDALTENFVTLFGATQYLRVRSDIVDYGKDSYFVVPDAVLADYNKEQRQARNNELPTPRI